MNQATLFHFARAYGRLVKGLLVLTRPLAFLMSLQTRGERVKEGFMRAETEKRN
jgi:hypothetical protein